MTATYERLKPEDIHKIPGPDENFLVDVLVGLSRRPKRLSSKYFYDRQGSRLFQKIMDLPEYYLTNCEFDILKSKRGEIAGLVKGRPFNLVELGAGDGRKTRLILDHFLEVGLEFSYLPIDISEYAMRKLTKSLGKELADLDIAVNCVTPAAARTRIFDQMSKEHIDYMLSKIPRNRFLEVGEAASMIAWLASKENSFSTGGVFDLSGGRATY